MTLPSLSSLEAVNAYSIRMEKLAQNQQKLEGQQAVELIKAAEEIAAAVPGPNGEGSLVNVYA